MNRTTFGVIASVCMGLGLLVAAPAVAQEGSDWEISGNVAVTTDYVYRGYSQSDGDFAIQGGMDVSHSSGLYLGVWGSSINFQDQVIEEDGSSSSAHVEIDLYGGFAGEFSNSMFTYDVGFIYYAYPGAPMGSSYDFYEFGLTFGADFGPAVVSVGAWWSPDFWGGSGDSLFIPIGIEVPIPIGDGPVGLSASANVGFNKFFDFAPEDDNTYINWDIGLTVSFDQWFDVDLRYYDTDVPAVNCNGICDSRFVAAISREF
jgi:uncharacterized protein (TIGR02001 family)